MDCCSAWMTYRFTVNLPHNQKKVMRISPKLTLGEVRQTLCNEKNFDPSRYVFLLPSNPENCLEDSVTVGDLKTSEINFVPVAMIDAASSRSMPDLALAVARANQESETRDDFPYMPTAGEKKAKRGFLSFLGKKDKKFKVQQDTEVEVRSKTKKSESFNTRTGRDTENTQARPKTMYAQSAELDHFGLRKTTGDLYKFSDKAGFRNSTGSALLPVNENVILSTKTDAVQQDVPSSAQNNRNSSSGAPPKKSAKKRAAPPPPQTNKTQPLTVQVEIDVHSKLPAESRIEDLPNERVHLKKNHSRNSSDSSGYHELTVSGADSPNANNVENLQTTLDTTSIDSAEHFNGDSGIRDMSPIKSANKGAKSGSKDSSLNIDKPVAPSRKKKRAPLPPPGMTGTVVSSETKPQGHKTPPSVSERQEEEEFAALQAMEEVTMKFNIEESDEEEDLKMVEDSSIYSEDIDIDVSHRQRPPMFIAPPPPTEPPPEDSHPVDLSMVVNQVDKIDIGVGEDTTSSGPDSVKSSPLSISRRGSRSSNSSINTLEDLSLAFAQTIEAGQEALGIDSDSDNDSVQEELKRAMPEFKESISKLTQDGAEDSEVSNRTNTSEQDEGSDQSFIIHDSETSKVENMETVVKSFQGNRESAEITYNFTVDVVPADFQNEKDEESDESFLIEETEILPAEPGIYDVPSPRSIPDIDSPKEHKEFSLPAHELHAEIPLDESTPKNTADSGRNLREMENEPVEEEKPPEKEEFVLTFDELSNLDFSATDPNEQKKPRKEPVDVPKVNYRIEFRSSLDLDNEVEMPATDVHQEPVFKEDHESYDNGAKTKCSGLNFSPNYETEDEHMLEEKSISQINLPAERKPIKDSETDINGAPVETYASSTKIVLSSSQSPSSQVSDTSPRKDDNFDSNSLMQAQYNQLQQQFTMWQNQLIQNQELLATQDASEFSTSKTTGKDEQSNLQLQQLQLQIQMQQQMMLQLQQSMQALALQNSIASQQQSFPQSVSQPLVATEALQIQQMPATQPSTQIFTKDNEKYRPDSPREQSQVLGYPKPPAPPAAPAPPAVVTSKPKLSKSDAKYSKPKQKRFERELDPREQLMLDIRNFGKKRLNKVPVKATHWHK